MGEARTIPIYLDDSELTKIAAVILKDVGLDPLPLTGVVVPDSAESYYSYPLDWFSLKLTDADFGSIYLHSNSIVPDFDTYFRSLIEIHKRRRKYARIMSAQPLPQLEQISPRSLLEFGIIASPALASWMTWRKWFYDIDNRSAQETGYLFEPILASVLGGVSYAAGRSPVHRKSDPNKGRQVDCIVGTNAYEFKLRVTIAASGQGRFREELDFADDARECGYRPILLVLDPTPSPRLAELTREFDRVGGAAFIGEDAWKHLEDQSGPTMATFVEKYVRRPITEVSGWESELLNLRIEKDSAANTINFTLSDEMRSFGYSIKRDVDPSLADSTDSDIDMTEAELD